jgi:GNAT superfamily N-acetyltransferase
MSEFEIEKLSEENFDEFISLMTEFAHYEKLDPPDEDAVKRLRDDGLGKNPKFEAYLGKYGKKYASYCIFFMTYSSFSGRHTLFLEDIFVLKEFRKKGIGQKILDFCIRTAKERECARLDLNVIEWNKLAIDFYKKNEFKFVNWDLYRLERKQIMEKG